MLFRLVYHSRNLLRRNAVAAGSELMSIAKAAEQNNLQLGISGALLFDKDTFAQVLEGDRPKVTQLFIRIGSDSRHTDISSIEAKSVTDRRFADWAMALIANPAASPVGPNFISGDAVVEMMVGLFRSRAAQHVALVQLTFPLARFRFWNLMCTLVLSNCRIGAAEVGLCTAQYC